MEEKRFPIFAKRLEELRGKRSQEEFAQFLGVSRPTVSYYESGARVPDAIILRQIAERCGVSADWLVGLADTRTPPQRSDFPEVEALIYRLKKEISKLSSNAKELDLYTLLTNPAMDIFPEHIELTVHKAIRRCYWVLEHIEIFKDRDGSIIAENVLEFLSCGEYSAKNSKKGT